MDGSCRSKRDQPEIAHECLPGAHPPLPFLCKSPPRRRLWAAFDRKVRDNQGRSLAFPCKRGNEDALLPWTFQMPSWQTPGSGPGLFFCGCLDGIAGVRTRGTGEGEEAGIRIVGNVILRAISPLAGELPLENDMLKPHLDKVREEAVSYGSGQGIPGIPPQKARAERQFCLAALSNALCLLTDPLRSSG